MPMHNQMNILENEWNDLPDGRRLAARTWLPNGDGPFPEFLEYLPYRKRDGTAPRDETTQMAYRCRPALSLIERPLECEFRERCPMATRYAPKHPFGTSRTAMTFAVYRPGNST